MLGKSGKNMREDHSRDDDGVGDADYGVDGHDWDMQVNDYFPSPAHSQEAPVQSFPSAAQCQEAPVHSVPGDGNCLFHALVAAATSIGGIVEPNITAVSLRDKLMRFLQDNRDNEILIPCLSTDRVSPEGHIRSQMPGRLVKSGDGESLIPCTSCLTDMDNTLRRHYCGGIPFADIRRLAASPVIYTNFDTYIKGMSQDAAFGEDLEIMAFCACYEVSIGVCHFASEWFDEGGRSNAY